MQLQQVEIFLVRCRVSRRERVVGPSSARGRRVRNVETKAQDRIVQKNGQVGRAGGVLWRRSGRRAPARLKRALSIHDCRSSLQLNLLWARPPGASVAAVAGTARRGGMWH
eukprot:37897-Chlamydomonas_euryale.AAC.15